MTENIFDNEQVTANSKQLEILKEHFPNCFDKSGNFQLDKFKEIIEQKDLNISQEGYSLNWLGKSYARLLANENPRTLLKPDNEHNDKPENKESQNLLIKGDNIEVLKHLKYAYTGAIKMIYIDPPYNTGSDGFVYQDDRKFTPTELAELANVTIEEAKRILSFTEKGSNSHSAWLTFMYPRLYVARQLLKEDGVICISIDENEQAQLKILCDEVFGEECYVGDFFWQKKTGASDAKDMAIITEYAIFYKKESSVTAFNLNSNSYDLNRYKLKDEFLEERGPYYLDNLDRGGLQYSDSLNYFILCPDGEKTYPNGRSEFINDGWIWKWSKEKVKWGVENGFIEFRKSTTKESGWAVCYKNYLNVDNKNQPINRGAPYKNLIQGVLNSDGNSDVKELFNGQVVFSYPKPVEFIKTILQTAIKDNEYVLDFFAGSGTTAHAVIELQLKTKTNYRFILVQLNELLDKSNSKHTIAIEYCKENVVEPTVFSITKARLEKVISKIKAKAPNYKGDLGFKIFETKPLPERYNDEIERLEKSTELFHAKDIAKDDLDAILTTWGLFDNIKLTDKFASIDLNGYEGYFAKETLYLMHPEFGMTQTKALIRKMEDDSSFVVEKIVLFAHNFDSKQQRELEEAMVSFRNKKSVDINVIKRY